MELILRVEAESGKIGGELDTLRKVSQMPRPAGTMFGFTEAPSRLGYCGAMIFGLEFILNPEGGLVYRISLFMNDLVGVDDSPADCLRLLQAEAQLIPICLMQKLASPVGSHDPFIRVCL